MTDDNLQGDITMVKHEISITGAKVDSKYGMITSDKFDVYVFTKEEDYNCYISSSTIWINFGTVEPCDFVYDRPEVIS